MLLDVLVLWLGSKTTLHGCLSGESELRARHWPTPAPSSPMPSTMDICLPPINRNFLNRHHNIRKLWAAGNWFASQEKPHTLFETQSLLPGLQDLRIVIVMSQMNPLHALLSCLFTVDLCIIICFHLGVTGGPFLFQVFQPKPYMHACSVSACYMYHLSHTDFRSSS